jgi:hypothetical protein
MRQEVYKDIAITLRTSEKMDIKELEEKKAKALLKALKKMGFQKGWTAKLTLVGSEHDSRLAVKYTIETGGRPKEVFYEPKRYNCKVDPHLHILLEGANPNDTITSYIYDYWTKRERKRNYKGYKTAHFKPAHNPQGFLYYMDKQASFKRCISL